MNELAKFDEVKAAIIQYKKENENLIFNYEDPKGNKEARSHIHKLRGVKTKIADIHKVAKAEALGVCRALDGKKKELTGEVDEMIDVHYKPVKEIEEREAKAAAEVANAERLERIRVEAERAAETERRENELAEKEATVKAKEDALAREQEKLEAAKQAEIDKATAVKAAQEQAERDKVAAIEAEQEKARQEAQRIKDEAAKIAAGLVAEQARIKAEALAKQEREAKIEAKRIADEGHRNTIEAEIALAISEISSMAEELGQDVGDAILTAIIDNEVPHVNINY